MDQNSKKPLSTITFRINSDINPKTLEFINEHFMKGKLSNIINDAIKIYCDILNNKDVLEYIQSMLLCHSKIKANTNNRRKYKKPNDIIGFRLNKDVSLDVLNIINEYCSNNKLTDFINTSLEIYRIIYRLASVSEYKNKEENLQDNKPSEIKSVQNQEISKNTKLAYKFLQSFRK